MRILKEEITKEPLPVSFVTDMMSKGWDEVGYLREASAAISETYEDTAKIEGLMQDLMDAYLVFIGQLELYLLEKEDIVAPTEDTEEESGDDLITGSAAVSKIKNQDTVETRPTPADLPAADLEIEPLEVDDATSSPAEPFEFFVDFDEPDMTVPALQDADIYDENNKPKMQLRG